MAGETFDRLFLRANSTFSRLSSRMGWRPCCVAVDRRSRFALLVESNSVLFRLVFGNDIPAHIEPTLSDRNHHGRTFSLLINDRTARMPRDGGFRNRQ